MADLIDRAAAIAEVTKRHWPQAVEAAKAIAAAIRGIPSESGEGRG